MVGIVGLLSTSSFGATNPNISPCLKGYITLQQGRSHLGWCRTCLTPIEIGKVGTFLSKGWIGYVDERSGLLCLMASTILGVLSRIQV